MFPAGAGVILLKERGISKDEGVSRRRGGDPNFLKLIFPDPKCFPQARG